MIALQPTAASLVAYAHDVVTSDRIRTRTSTADVFATAPARLVARQRPAYSAPSLGMPASRPTAARRAPVALGLDAEPRAGRSSRDPVGTYLEEIGRYPLLSRADEVRLSAIALDTGKSEEERENAAQQLVLSNLRLVVSICRDFTRDRFPLLDLVSPGNEGLIVASRKYDGSLGVPFANYASQWIKQRVMKYTAEHGFDVRVPPYRAGIVNQVLRTNARLTQILERQPHAEEVTEALNAEIAVRKAKGKAKKEQKPVSIDEVREVLKMLQPTLELDAPLATEDNATFGAYFGESIHDAEARVTDNLHAIDLQRAIADALATLSSREAQVLEWFFGLNGLERPLDLDQIAAKLGVTRERARQIKAGALKALGTHANLAALLTV